MGFFDKLKGGMGIEESEKVKTAKPKKKVKSAAPKGGEPRPEDSGREPEKKIKLPKIELKKEEPKKEEPPAKGEARSEERQTEGELAIDVFETDNDIVIQSTIGGTKPEDLDISVENDLVTIRGNREKSVEKEGKKYFYQECYWGSFMRQVILPEEVDGARAKASMKNGVLTLTMPKLHRKKKRKIMVKPEE